MAWSLAAIVQLDGLAYGGPAVKNLSSLFAVVISPVKTPTKNPGTSFFIASTTREVDVTSVAFVVYPRTTKTEHAPGSSMAIQDAHPAFPLRTDNRMIRPSMPSNDSRPCLVTGFRTKGQLFSCRACPKRLSVKGLTHTCIHSCIPRLPSPCLTHTSPRFPPQPALLDTAKLNRMNQAPRPRRAAPHRVVASCQHACHPSPPTDVVRSCGSLPGGPDVRGGVGPVPASG